MVRKILIVFCMCLLSVGSIAQQEKISQEVVSYITVYEPFAEPIEVCYIIPNDGKKIIKVTSGLENAIFFVPSIKEILAKYGYEIKDINIWIHNHLVPSSFSKDDLIIYWYLTAQGFEGIYMLKTPQGVYYYAPIK